MKKQPRYRYDKVICERVVDADTIDVIIDLGFGIKKKERLRLYRINAWETRGKEKEKGLLAKEFVELKLGRTLIKCNIRYGNEKYPATRYTSESETFRIETFKKGKFGRMLANVLLGEGKKCLNDELVEKGHAKYQDY